MKQYAFAPQHALYRWAVAGALALGLAACGGGGSESPVAILTAALSGDQETTPTNTGALGTGTLTLTLDSRALTGGIEINGMTATAAHVHLGDVGSNGAVIVELAESTPGSGSWSVPAGTVLTEAQATAFSAGGLYFNAHTPENPGGEIRGQIGREVYAAQLSASQEVPTNASTATGVGSVSLDPTTKRFTARLTLTGIAATMAHVHTGAVGANGGVSFPMTETATGSGIWISAADANMGGAEIGKALRETYLVAGRSESADIFLVTDGEVSDWATVVDEAKKSSHRIFTVGVGSAVSEAFVRELAASTGGECEFVSPREGMADRVVRHFERMRAPRAKRVAVRWPDGAANITPARIGADSPDCTDGTGLRLKALLGGTAGTAA